MLRQGYTYRHRQRLHFDARARGLVLGGVYTAFLECKFHDSAGLMIIGNVAWIALVGHTSTHFPQALHRAGFIYAKLSFTSIAPQGHSREHLPQPMQEAEQTFRATAPLSRLEHATHTRRSCLPAGRNSIR